MINATAGEDCDDGNAEDGDGCSATCSVEPEPETTGDSADSGTGTDGTAGEGSSSDEGGRPDDTGDSGASGDDGDTDTDGASAAGDEGCGSCTTAGGRGPRAWLLFAFLGLGALRRRRPGR
jgi:MYXO-CTERM domain-containing protein